MMSKSILDNYLLDEVDGQRPIVQALLNKNLASLSQSNFIIFPERITDSEDLSNDNFIFKSEMNGIRAGNIVGLFNDEKGELRIKSRFSVVSDHNDYFLRYMIQTVLNYNVIDQKLELAEETSYYDLLAFLFPYYLNRVAHKGIYKEYVKREYNDMNIRGSIDIARHIRKNSPFQGKIAYKTREFSFDNNVTQLIRHTIEKLAQTQQFLLTSNEETKINVDLIRQATQKYNYFDRKKVIQTNIDNPVKHGYFKEYTDLQQICLQILAEQKVGFGNNQKRINGIIIDVAWLWEAYIDKITKWKHFGRKPELETMQLFNEKGNHRYPDFVFETTPIDTKYKKQIDTRNDYNQIITYMYIMEANQGGFLQPTSDSKEPRYQEVGTLNGFGGKIFIYKFYIPQMVDNYTAFVAQIKKSETDLAVKMFGEIK